MTIQDAYKEIDFRVITIVAGLTTIGDAIVKNGMLRDVAGLLQSLSFVGHPFLLLLVLVVVSSLIAQLLDNTLSVLLLGPIALEFARVVPLSPHCLLMAVSLGASFCFQAPFSHRANLLIIGAGGYKVRDFLAIGSLMTVALAGVLVALLPLVYSQ
jgi:di/tricarboxylate transporter